MDESTEFFSVKKIKLRTPQFIYARTLLIFTFIYTVCFIGGCLLFHFSGMQSNDGFNVRILSYFATDFSGCEDIFDYSSKLLSISKSDVCHLLIIFSAGFTMLCGAVVSSLLAYRGFSLGFSLSYLVRALQNGDISLENSALKIIVFATVSAITASILLIFSVKTVFFCDDFKALCGIPRKIILSKALYAHVARFMTAFGAFLLINLLRCLL